MGKKFVSWFMEFTQIMDTNYGHLIFFLQIPHLVFIGAYTYAWVEFEGPH